MLFEPARHEALQTSAWDEHRVRAAIAAIVRDTEAAQVPGRGWPMHPNDLDAGEDPQQPNPSFYFGAAGVVWALRYLDRIGAAARGPWREDLGALRAANRAWLASFDSDDHGAYLMGELPIALMAFEDDPAGELAQTLPGLLERTLDHPARELMWGAPGALLAAAFLHERSGEERWAEGFRRIAARLRSQLVWSEEHACWHWTQDLYGRHCSYLDAVHGFVATASALLRGRHLLPDWPEWQPLIATTVRATARWEDGLVNWPAQLADVSKGPSKWLMQFCHGSPGFVICLARWPGAELDPLLLAAGEATWRAGPLAKGANLCHGTAGNGYAFLVLYQRSGDVRWLDRARAFAMHALAQSEADRRQFGQGRHSLWTGDPGLAIYLWDCLRARAAFPTLEVFFA